MAIGISRYVWLLCTTARCLVPAYTNYDIQLRNVASDGGLKSPKHVAHLMINKDTLQEFVHLVGLLIYTLQQDARCIQRQIDVSLMQACTHFMLTENRHLFYVLLSRKTKVIIHTTCCIIIKAVFSPYSVLTFSYYSQNNQSLFPLALLNVTYL